MINIRHDTKPWRDDEVLCFFNEDLINQSDQKEFVANEKYESSLFTYDERQILFNDIVFKSNFIKTFQSLLPMLNLSGSETILEMGSSHGWASVYLKKEYPRCYIVASDLVPDTVKHAKRWENLLGSYIDEKWAFNCRDIPFEEEQFDRIFTFASFHHFGENGDYHKSLEELIRVLKKGGKIILLYEPSSPKYLYKIAYQRANKKRDIEGVDEDVLVPSNIAKIIKSLGCNSRIEFFPFYLYRDSIIATNYYYVLSRLGPFQKLLVSTVNIVIEK